MSGPDYVYPTDNVYTWDADGYTKIQKTSQRPANMEPKSLVTVVKEQCKEGGDNMIAFQVKRDGEWIKWSYTDYYTDIQCVARAFVKLGLEERKTVCIQGFNSPEWFLSCQGAIHAGGLVSKLCMHHIIGILVIGYTINDIFSRVTCMIYGLVCRLISHQQCGNKQVYPPRLYGKYLGSRK